MILLVVGRRFYRNTVQLDVVASDSSDDTKADNDPYSCIDESTAMLLMICVTILGNSKDSDSSETGGPGGSEAMIQGTRNSEDSEKFREELKHMKSQIKLGDRLKYTENIQKKFMEKIIAPTVSTSSPNSESDTQDQKRSRACSFYVPHLSDIVVQQENFWESGRASRLRLSLKAELLGENNPITHPPPHPPAPKFVKRQKHINKMKRQRQELEESNQQINEGTSDSVINGTTVTVTEDSTNMELLSEQLDQNYQQNAQSNNRISIAPDAIAFSSWLVEKFGLTSTKSHNQNIPETINIVDIAGGKGELSSMLVEKLTPYTVTTTTTVDTSMNKSNTNSNVSILKDFQISIIDPKQHVGGLSRARRRWMRQYMEDLSMSNSNTQCSDGLGKRVKVIREMFITTDSELADISECVAIGGIPQQIMHNGNDNINIDHIIISNSFSNYGKRKLGDFNKPQQQPVPASGSPDLSDISYETESTIASPSVSECININIHDDIQTNLSHPLSLTASPSSPLHETCENATVLLGLHPDEATDSIVDYAVSRRIPFAVVPCCVFYRKFRGRRIKVYSNNTNDGPGSVLKTRPVYTQKDLIEYLCQKHPDIKREILKGCGGANEVVYCFFGKFGEDSAGTTTSSSCVAEMGEDSGKSRTEMNKEL